VLYSALRGLIQVLVSILLSNLKFNTSSVAQCTQGCQVGILRPNSRNLAFFKVVWHEKMVFGMYVIVWHFLAFFDGVGMKRHCLAFYGLF